VNRVAGAWFLGVAICCMQAAGAQSLPDRIRRCAAESNGTTRLDCYDEIGASLNGIPTPAPVPVPAPEPNAAAAASPATPESQFGIAGGKLEQKKESAAPKEIHAVVSGVARRPRGELVITLDNGQVWAQLTPQEFFPLQAGDTVVIAKGALGSYSLATPAKRGAKVTRLL
jgi:hypothetical protein